MSKSATAASEQQNEPTGKQFEIPAPSKARERKQKDPTKVLEKHFTREMEKALGEQRELVEDFIGDFDPEYIIRTLLNIQHDLAVAESTLGDAWPQKTPEGLSGTIGIINHVVNFVHGIKDAKDFEKTLICQMDKERMKREMAELALKLAALEQQQAA